MTTNPETAQMREFLADYEALCRRYGLKVDSCSCCDSPWIIEPSENHTIDRHIAHLRAGMEADA